MRTRDRIVVHQAGHVAAICTPERVFLSRAIGAMPDRHPDRRLVLAQCLIAGAALGDDRGVSSDDATTDR